MKNTKKLIVISAVAVITLYQVLNTISICSGKQNIQMVYQVKEGENINSVAKKFGTTAEKLQQLNNIDSANAGTRLKIQ